MTIINLYNPGKNLSKDEFLHYFKQCRNKFIICGDFNGHHHMWESNKDSNITGNNLVDSVLDEDVFLFSNAKRFTYLH